jgi:hypothetical protein
MPAKQYRRRVETVDAIQYVSGNKDEVIEFASGVITENSDGSLQMSPAPGISFVLVEGSWVLKNAGGSYSSMAEDQFDLFYQPGGGGGP